MRYKDNTILSKYYLDTDRPARNADGGIRHRGQRGVEPGARHGREPHRGNGQQGNDTVPVPGAVL